MKPPADKARANHAERDTAQPECIAYLNSIGYAEKHRDGVGASGMVRCVYCEKMTPAQLVAITHTDKGVADYLGSVKTPAGPIAYAVEVKAGGLVFPMNWIDADQWKWTKDWEDRTGGISWFWLMMGTHALNAVASNGKFTTPHPFRRVTYLIPRGLMWNVYNDILAATDGKQTIIPMNDKVERVRYGSRYAAQNLYADVRFARYRMVRREGSGIWHPNIEHPFKIYYPQEELNERQPVSLN